ncbi:MAG: GIDE domain-containing protein, partial [Nocardioidaceae bacterium]
MWIWGVVLLGVAGFCGFTVWNARKSIQRMTVTETVTAADLMKLHEAAVAAGGEGSFSETVEVKGVVRTGPGGTLTSQLTGTACAWHRHKVERKYTERYRDSKGNRRTRTKTETLTSHRTEDLFSLEDATGTVLVRPAVVVDKPKKVLDDFREPKAQKRQEAEGFLATVGQIAGNLVDDDDTIGFRHREWVLEDGARVYVLGEASDAEGELVVTAPSDGSKQLISTQTEDQLSEQHGT